MREPDTMAEWLATRPLDVQRRAKQYPPGSILVDPDGLQTFVMGYTEEEGGRVGLWVTPMDPRVDYDAAHAGMFRICADHLPALDAEVERMPRMLVGIITPAPGPEDGGEVESKG